MSTFTLAPGVPIGGGAPLVLFAGPCQIESREHAMFMAESLIAAIRGLPISLVYKSSFDKANRTKISSARGIGIDEGLTILAEIRREFSIPLVTDIHSPEQAQSAGEVVDVLQIPAFLCRQTDLLIAAGKTNRTIHVKKGQFLHPSDMAHVAEKIASTGNQKVILCERGTCFGYRDLIVDPRSLIIMARTGYPVSFDATHSVQSMGSESGVSGGNREFIAPLAKAAVAIGVDALFIECHENPSLAPSDGMSMLPLLELRPLLEELMRIRDAVKGK